MTRKDYVLLAEALASVRPGHTSKVTGMGKTEWEACVHAIERALAADNPNFDSVRFREACEK